VGGLHHRSRCRLGRPQKCVVAGEYFTDVDCNYKASFGSIRVCGVVGLRKLRGARRAELKTPRHLFSPGIFWNGLIVNLSGCEVQALQTNSYGVRPRSVLRRLAKL
jgi:hypothetical protein